MCHGLSPPAEKGHSKKEKIAQKKILPFVTQYHLASPNAKNLGQHTDREVPTYLKPTHRKGKSLKYILVKNNL